METKLLSGFAVVQNGDLTHVTYSYNVVNEKGIIASSNQNESYIVLDQEEQELINGLKNKIKEKIKSA